MQLSDRTIRRQISVGFIDISPRPQDHQFQPATVDLTLGSLKVDGGLPYLLKPGEFVLGSTLETITIPANMSAQVKGKSSWARRGLMVEGAGFVDPGFHGQITLELKNLHHEEDILLSYGDLNSQIAFYLLDVRCDRPYGHPELRSHYQGQLGPTPSAL